MLIVGLTGGIGSGKTTVAHHFAALGVPVIDADQVARDLVVPGSPLLEAIARRFGNGMLTTGRELDRARMRTLIFKDPDARRELEAILHPAIRQEMQRRLGDLHAPYCILVIPLLAETGQVALVDRVLVVDVSEAAQISRTSTRDRMSADAVRDILAAQATREARLALADDVISNEGDRAALASRVRDLHVSYLGVAASGVCQKRPSAGE